MKKIFKAIAIVIIVLVALATSIQARQFPQPVNFVSDFANIIDDQAEMEINASLKSLKETTTNEVAVVTLESLEDDVIENVAVELFEQWSIGTKENDNGVLFLIVPNERKVKIEVGYGLEPVITDSRAGTIIRTIVTPRFKEDNYTQGVVDGVSTITKAITEDPTIFDEPIEITQSSAVMGSIIFGGIVLVYLSSFFSRSKRFWPGGVIGFFIGLFQHSLTIAIIVGLWGLFLDYMLSKNYKKRKARGLPTSWWSSGGGFSSGKRGGGGGFGGFSGGSSGGGGASGSW